MNDRVNIDFISVVLLPQAISPFINVELMPIGVASSVRARHWWRL